ncbi:MAG: peptidylprolyl isomerase [Armatimonadetes bacterium]|nr:peptidylprolyl isomerase [Armatimonadota bacterium]
MLRTKLVFVIAACMLLMVCGLAAGSAQARPGKGETWLQLNVDGKGVVVIKLETAKAPKTTEHIASLASSGFYDGQKFFKVIKEPRPFLVQFGDPASKSSAKESELGQGGSGTRVAYEDSGLANVEGAVGLSTLPRDPNSGDSIFYICLSESKFLDGKYTVFGKVVAGMDIVKAVKEGDKVSSVSILRG